MIKKTSAQLSNLIQSLAREAVETYVRHERIIKNTSEHPFLLKPAAAFVSLKIKKQLRGCLGSMEPQKKTLAEEIIANAISAATHDYRFNPVQMQELAHVAYSVDVLSKLTPVESLKELNAKKYGIMVEKGIAKGLLLPDLEGVETVKQQLDIAKHKAGIFDDSGLTIYKFEVQRF